jgi:glycosyltransferase involved in cell wall biosynthesis
MQPADDDRSEPRRHSGPRPLVSVGMPVYNGEAYVEAAIRSVLDQTLSALELIIYDNASTDRTGDICARYAASDGRVRYFRNAENLGAHPNYNLTFRPATGKYFKWAAHDDVLKPTYLERCVAALEKTPDAVVCQSTLEYIDAEDEIIGVYDSNLVGSASDSAATRFASVILRPHPAYEIMGVFRRDALLDSMLLESFHGADRALLAEVSLRGRMLRVAEPLLRVREHKGRYTQSHIRPKERAVRQAEPADVAPVFRVRPYACT